MTRLSAGWKLAMSSFGVIKEKKELIIFPMLSGISIVLVMGSFFVALFSAGVFESEPDEGTMYTPLSYLLVFAFYIINYFIIVFFNMALVHCARLYFLGEEVTVRAGIQFSLSRIGVIFSWAVFAATIGLLLRVIQENLGWIGKILIGLVGVVWSVATFFVVPVIAYENAGPIDAVKRSSSLMKEKWGESLGANFSFGLIQFISMFVVAAVLFALGYLIHPLVGIGLAAVGCFIVFSIISAAEMIFVSAVYHNINGDLSKHFDAQLVDDLFATKSKSMF